MQNSINSRVEHCRSGKRQVCQSHITAQHIRVALLSILYAKPIRVAEGCYIACKVVIADMNVAGTAEGPAMIILLC